MVNFLIVSFVIFLLARQANRLKAEPAPAAPATKECAYCHLAIPIPAVRCPHCTSDLSRA